MKIKSSQFKAIAYSEVFNFPIKKEEVIFWQIGRDNKLLNKDIRNVDGYLLFSLTNQDVKERVKTQKKTIIQDKEHTSHYQSITSISYLQKTKENNYGYTEKTPEKSS